MFALPRIPIGLSVSLALGCVTPVYAQDALETFVSLCIPRSGDRSAAITGAQALDFSPAPEDWIGSLSSSGFLEVQVVLNNRPMDVVGDGAMAVITGYLPIGSGPDAVRADVCSVMVYGGDSSDMSRRVTEWIGFSPEPLDVPSWPFSVIDGVRVGTPNFHGFPITQEIAARGNFYVIGVTHNNGGAAYTLFALPAE